MGDGGLERTIEEGGREGGMDGGAWWDESERLWPLNLNAKYIYC